MTALGVITVSQLGIVMTVNAALADIDAFEAVTKVWPGPTAVTRPFASMVATVTSLVVHVRFVSGSPMSSIALSVTDSPTARVNRNGMRAMDVGS